MTGAARLAVPAVAWGLPDASPAAAALRVEMRNLGEELAEQLRALLLDRDPDVRLSARMALERLSR